MNPETCKPGVSSGWLEKQHRRVALVLGAEWESKQEAARYMYLATQSFQELHTFLQLCGDNGPKQQKLSSAA